MHVEILEEIKHTKQVVNNKVDKHDVINKNHSDYDYEGNKHMIYEQRQDSFLRDLSFMRKPRAAIFILIHRNQT